MANKDDSYCGKTVTKTTVEETKYGNAACEIEKGTLQYIGARYVPVFANPVEWSNTRPYEHLTMVQNQGNTYISKQAVPVGVPLPSNGEQSNDYWVFLTNWNAQIEEYRQEVEIVAKRLYTCSSVAQIVSSSVKPGDLIFTSGYYEDSNDGACAYTIGNSSVNGLSIRCDNGMYATPIIGKHVSTSMLGINEETDASKNVELINEALSLMGDKCLLTVDTSFSTDSTIVAARANTVIKGSRTTNYEPRITFSAQSKDSVCLEIQSFGSRIIGIEFACSQGTVDAPFGNAIRIVRTADDWDDLDAVVQNCGFNDFDISIYAIGKNILVSENTFTHPNIGVYFDSSKDGIQGTQIRGWIVENNVFHGGAAPASQPVDLYDYPKVAVKTARDALSREIVVSNNRFNSNYIGMVYVGSGCNLTIENNRGEGHTTRASIGLLIRTSGIYTPPVIRNNVFQRQSAGSGDFTDWVFGSLVYFEGNLSEAVIEGNVSRYLHYNILTCLNEANNTRLHIVNNILYHPSKPGIEPMIDYFADYEGRDLIIMGNDFRKSPAAPISLTSQADIVYLPSNPAVLNVLENINP